VTKRGSEQAEEFVKNYQLDITNGKIDALIISVNGMQKQVSDFQLVVQTRPSNEQVDDKIKVAVANMEKDLSTAMKEIKLELGPPVKTSNRLLWALLSSGLAIFVALIMVVIGFFVK
jgi:hypothetical protein